ncbi:hypothetical protein GCM10012279_59330 [Micromonospora yangpuensis]|nr:hypothetical protein GCM10012279_59330 [Micromonospora yangpuensis]
MLLHPRRLSLTTYLSRTRFKPSRASTMVPEHTRATFTDRAVPAEDYANQPRIRK